MSTNFKNGALRIFFFLLNVGTSTKWQNILEKKNKIIIAAEKKIKVNEKKVNCYSPLVKYCTQRERYIIVG